MSPRRQYATYHRENVYKSDCMRFNWLLSFCVLSKLRAKKWIRWKKNRSNKSRFFHIKNQSTENRKSYKINSNKSFYSKPNGLLLRITTHFIPTLAGNKISKWNQNDFCKRKRFTIRKKNQIIYAMSNESKSLYGTKNAVHAKKTKEKKINRNVHPNENACS